MWAKMKKNGLWILFIVFGIIFGSNIYVVGEGLVSKADNWFTMTIWAGMFFVYWVVEMYTTRKLKKTLDNMFEISHDQTRLNMELLEDNIRMAMDNKALIEENQRLEKQNVIKFRERKHD